MSLPTKEYESQINHNDCHVSGRRSFMALLAGATAATAFTATRADGANAERRNVYADPPNPALPKGNMELDLKRAALVVIDPQIDFMSPKGRAWPVVGESVTEHNIVSNIGRLFQAAKEAGVVVAISPHYYYAWVPRLRAATARSHLENPRSSGGFPTPDRDFRSKGAVRT